MVATECRYIGLDRYYSVAATKFEDFWPVNRTIEGDPRCCSIQLGMRSFPYSTFCSLFDQLTAVRFHDWLTKCHRFSAHALESLRTCKFRLFTHIICAFRAGSQPRREKFSVDEWSKRHYQIFCYLTTPARKTQINKYSKRPGECGTLGSGSDLSKDDTPL
jgi:hypothetical protein